MTHWAQTQLGFQQLIFVGGGGGKMAKLESLFWSESIKFKHKLFYLFQSIL